MVGCDKFEPCKIFDASQNCDLVTGFLLTRPTYDVREAYSYNTPRSLPLIRKSAAAPTSETPTTPRNLLLYLTPTTILQQTSSTRPSALPCEPLQLGMHHVWC